MKKVVLGYVIQKKEYFKFRLEFNFIQVDALLIIALKDDFDLVWYL